jgi:hypothetical protein
LKFGVLALDYDGTIARDGVLDPDVRTSLVELRAHGIRVILVTGRILSDLERVAGDLKFADAVVAENGAVIAFPNGHSWAVGQPPPAEFLDELRHRAIGFTEGQCIVETDATLAPQILSVIRERELPLALLFNRGRLMVLPQAVSKSTGLRIVLTALRLSIHNTVAVGDAENDNDLLAACEMGAAVGWGSRFLQKTADAIVPGAGPPDLAPYIRQAASWVRLPPHWIGRHRISLGVADDGEQHGFAIGGRNMLITGDPGSGKSWLCGLLCEQLMLHDYCTCVIDPEGDYEQLESLPRVVAWRGADLPSSLPDLDRILRHPDVSVVVNLSRLPYKDKIAYLRSLLPLLASVRRDTGLPHRIVIDEAHYFLQSSNLGELLDLTLGAYTLVTYRPSELPSDLWKVIEVMIATRTTDPREVAALQAISGRGDADWNSTLAGLAIGKGVLLPSRDDALGKLRCFSLFPRLTAQIRHRAKYLDVPVQSGREFVFTSDGRPIASPSRTLQEFVLSLGSVSSEALVGHVHRGDFSRWIGDVFHDQPLASEVRNVEEHYRVSDDGKELRDELVRAIRKRYDVETQLEL